MITELINILSNLRLNWLCEDTRTVFKVKHRWFGAGIWGLILIVPRTSISRFSAILWKSKVAGHMKSYSSMLDHVLIFIIKIAL